MEAGATFSPQDWSRAVTRRHPESVDEAPFALDRTRVVRSAAFRRLQHKTQVFVATEADHFRTRLTHSLEVADLSRRLAGALGLEVDLAEVAALAHDLGHPPFGHAGERALDELLREHGGFEHNAHALRVVEYLEHPYPQFRGLNLTHVVRECLAKHATRYDQPGAHPLQDGHPAPLEGQVVAMADRLTYALHDLQDGLYAGLIEPSKLAELEFLKMAGFTETRSDEALSWIRSQMDSMSRLLTADLIKTTRAAWRRLGVDEPRQARALPQPQVSLSFEFDAKLQELEAILRESVYRSPRLARMDSKAKRILAALFEAYVAEPQLLPRRYAERAQEQGVWRVAADYLAGMTDRFAMSEHARLFDPRIEV